MHAHMHKHVCTHTHTPFPWLGHGMSTKGTIMTSFALHAVHRSFLGHKAGTSFPPKAKSEQPQAKSQHLLPPEGGRAERTHLLISGDMPLMLRKRQTPADRTRRDPEGWCGCPGVPTPAPPSDRRACPTPGSLGKDSGGQGDAGAAGPAARTCGLCCLLSLTLGTKRICACPGRWQRVRGS